MLRILHFADAHIDMANYGRHDPQTGLPLRVMDFLTSLDEIIKSAIDNEVDLVIFAGDAYKDRNPAPTYQREWGRRIMRLSRAGIPTILLVGNHDVSPAFGRANAINEFTTLEVPNVWVVDKPSFLGPEQLAGLPIQILAIPWISRSGMMTHLSTSIGNRKTIYQQMVTWLMEQVESWIRDANHDLPRLLTAHVSVEGAVYGGERSVMLGNDLVLPISMVQSPDIDYVALGHIHKAQNLTNDQKTSSREPPPVVYPGSIERVDFGEAADKKYFVIVEVSCGQSKVNWHELKNIRNFIDRSICLESSEGITAQLKSALPGIHELENAIVRLTIYYQRDWEAMIDEAAIRDYVDNAFEFQLVKRPQFESRVRLEEGRLTGSLTPLELVDAYWEVTNIDKDDARELSEMAAKIISDSAE